MHFTLTINIGVTPQLESILNAVLGAQPQARGYVDQDRSAADETVRPTSQEASTETAPVRSAESAPDTSASAQDAGADTPKARRGRPPRDKATTVGSESGAAVQATSESEEPGPNATNTVSPSDPFSAKPSAGAQALGVGDPFSQNVKTAVKETQAESSGEPTYTYTVKDLNDAATEAMLRVKASGVKEAIAALNLVDAEGKPVDRLQTIQPADYERVVAKFRELAA